MSKTEILFEKWTSSGNDFIIFESKYIKKILPRIKKICNRKWGIGADGILFHKKKKKAGFRMIYYNADGSRAEFCANGARCLVHYYFLKTGEKNVIFEADDGEHRGKILKNNGVEISLKNPSETKPNFNLKGIPFSLSFTNSGVPHVVIFTKNLFKIDLLKWGKKIRFHPFFSPFGTNVNFVETNYRNSIKVRTYERGVEDEVLACGTGVVASAFLAREKFNLKFGNFFVHTKGGEILKVRFEKNKTFLSGKVEKVFEGKIFI